MPTLHVDLGDRGYDIIVEPGVLSRLGGIVREVVPHDHVFVAIDANVEKTHAPPALISLEQSGYSVSTCTLVADERQKSLDAVRELYDAMLEARLDRKAPVIAIGGGIIGDTAGFAAATFLRGVPLIQAPTTLLAMVDASIGGKTGVNIDIPAIGTLGKNLVGAFWQPRCVVADPKTLGTLPPRDFRCGIAECIKHAIISDPQLFQHLEGSAEDIEALDLVIITALIARSAAAKVRIVEADEREAGKRAWLNLGHTFAHAIEPIPELDLRHGEAVAIGLCAAASCAVSLKMLDQREAARIHQLVKRFDLPAKLPVPIDAAQLVEAMGYDKKTLDGQLRLVLPARIGAVEVVTGVEPDFIENAWHSVGAQR